MAKKTNIRAAYKEVGSQNRNHETLPDEITLRDEILELKRQVMVLRRANEQYLVKLRKYEDEAKRKDKQVEQLMDPRKNADVTKVLSTKGAAILMNLKDQNNALIQMILNKDLHIRKLVSEIKMSKLYASTRKNESYRAEINRLRNLLIKSQEALKENVDVQKQERSICASGNSLLECSPSSDQSSPRDLDELRVTILGLESHIQNSNDLLAKKNQEISFLTNEVNFLRKYFRYRTYKNKAFDCKEARSKNQKFSTTNLTHKWSEPLSRDGISTQKVLDLFGKNQEDENLPHSAPAIFTDFSTEYTPKCSFPSHGTGERKNPAQENIGSEGIMKTDQKSIEKLSVLKKSLFLNSETNELPYVEQIPSNPKAICAKEKWMKVLYKYREHKKLERQISTMCSQIQSGSKRSEETVTATEFFDEETEKSTQREPQKLAEESESSKPLQKGLQENVILGTSIGFNSGTVNGIERFKMRQGSESPSALIKNKEPFYAERVLSNETHHFEREGQNKEQNRSAETENGDTETLHNVTYTEESDTSKKKSLREMYSQSTDSSFDSESSYSTKQKVEVEVEVQIDSVSPQNDSDQSLNSIPENNLTYKCGRENGENRAPELDFNDDDDVIVRERKNSLNCMMRQSLLTSNFDIHVAVARPRILSGKLSTKNQRLDKSEDREFTLNFTPMSNTTRLTSDPNTKADNLVKAKK